MDIKSGDPWWLIRNQLLREYPALGDDCTCEVAVVGAGITGALIASELVEAGIDTIVVDKREAAWGSTSATTALIQYELDTELVPLIEMLGETDALRIYKACERAVRELGECATELGETDYRDCASLYFVGARHHLKRLRREQAARDRGGFAVEWLGQRSLYETFGLRAPAAILSRPAAQVDPYRFTHALLARACVRGLRVFDRTEISELESGRARVTLHSAPGPSIHAQHVIIAAGYETERFLKERVARNSSTYAFVSEPIDDLPDSLMDVIAWETRRPYLYWRTAASRRMLVGGMDDSVDLPFKRDRRVAAKVAKLLKSVRKLLPDLPLEASFGWAGTFAETSDGLPYFGPHPQCDPRVLFALAHGGNGITYAAIGAHILREAIQGGTHELARLFGFERQTR
ncbi:MAG: NAD(P)/FAD-dependent oxidoreductase [Rhodanobacteraceae bacterium]